MRFVVLICRVTQLLENIQHIAEHNNFFDPGFRVSEMDDIPDLYHRIIDDPAVLHDTVVRLHGQLCLCSSCSLASWRQFIGWPICCTCNHCFTTLCKLMAWPYSITIKNKINKNENKQLKNKFKIKQRIFPENPVLMVALFWCYSCYGTFEISDV